MNWVYYDYMGTMNPVCKDVGRIIRIVPNYPAVQGTYSQINEIETDEGRFGCDMKFSIVRIGGFCSFDPIRDPNAAINFISLDGIKHGDTVDLHANNVLMVDGSSLSPITTDPRVLCIIHRAHDELPMEPTEEQFKEFCRHIPDKEEAIEYLKRKDAYKDCIPWSAVKYIFNKERN